MTGRLGSGVNLFTGTAGVSPALRYLKVNDPMLRVSYAGGRGARDPACIFTTTATSRLHSELFWASHAALRTDLDIGLWTLDFGQLRYEAFRNRSRELNGYRSKF